MNKTFAAHWDAIAVLAADHHATLLRDGHRFTYHWSTDAGVEVQVWAAESQPSFGVRVGDVSARCWTVEALAVVLAALTVHAAGPQPPEGA